MNCTDMRELLSAYANGELPRTQRDFAEEHLAGCAQCQESLADYDWVRGRLTSLRAVPEGMDIDIREETMIKIETLGAQRRPVRHLLRPALVAAAVVAAIMVPLLFQLWGGSSGGPIARAYAATAALQSYRMSGTTAQVFNGVASETTFEYEFAAPGRFRSSMVADGELREFIVVDDRQYTRVPGDESSRNVVEIVLDGGFSVYNPIPSGEGTLELLNSLIDLKELSGEEVDGVETVRHRGRVDVDRIVDEQVATLDPQSPVYPETVEFLDLQRSIRIDVELWISKEDYSIRRMKLDGQFPTTGTVPDGAALIGSSSHSTVVRYFDFDEPIQVEHPLTASGELEPGWRLAGGGPPAPTIELSEKE